jgi:hypothetical protein
MYYVYYFRLIIFVTLIIPEHFDKIIVLTEAKSCYCFPLPVGTNDIEEVTVPDFSRISDQPVSG